MNAGKIFVIGFVVIALGVGAASVWMIAQGSETVRANQAGIGLAKVQKAAAVWAEEKGRGAYPKHVALLRPNNYFRRTLLEDPRRPEGSVWEVRGLDARPFMDELQRATIESPLDRTPLEQAVEEFDATHDSLFYRFGDYWFVRLPRYTNDPFLVFGWTLPDEDGRRFVVFDNGEAKRIEPESWGAVWRTDAEARKRWKFEPIEAPK